MLFSSLTFLFAFLPLMLAIYFLVKDKYKNYVLLAASLLFYAWGEPKYIILMLLSIIFNYFIALLINREKKQKHKKILLVTTVVINIGALVVFKYLDFIINNTNLVLGTNIGLPKLVLPIGISFYTFQILSYVIDVYRKKVKPQKNIFVLGTYIALFPQLIAGPIVRYSAIEEQLKKRQHDIKKFCAGFRRFIIGFTKKVLIANNVAVIADAVFNNPSTQELAPAIIMLALLAYTLQIYYDFSGYSDMAIGLGKIFGFDFDENFDHPYASLSVTDFWRRWHISLTTWFRDYLYIPLGGNRCSKIKWARNFFTVWLLTGLWHGASWNFVLWGMFCAIILLFEKQLFNKFLTRIPRIIKWIYTFLIVNIGWLIFRANNLSDLKYLLESFIHPQGSLIDFLSNNYSITHYFIFIILGLIFMFPIRNNKVAKKLQKTRQGRILANVVLIILFVIGIAALVSSSYNPFIYFRF